MSVKLIKIAKMFRLALCEYYNDSLQRNAPPEGLSWLKSAFVFCSLEACRDLVCDPARKEEVYCRFTAGDMLHPKERPDLEAIATEIRKLVRKKRLLHHKLEEAPNKLVEWITDFFLS
jgi:hypothetical protein